MITLEMKPFLESPYIIFRWEYKLSDEGKEFFPLNTKIRFLMDHDQDKEDLIWFTLHALTDSNTIMFQLYDYIDLKLGDEEKETFLKLSI